MTLLASLAPHTNIGNFLAEYKVERKRGIPSPYMHTVQTYHRIGLAWTEFITEVSCPAEIEVDIVMTLQR